MSYDDFNVKWKRLDLRAKETMPPMGALVVLYLKSKDAFPTVRYETGRFKQDLPNGDKTVYWRGLFTGIQAAKLKRRYDIWWCPLPEFDGKPY